MIKPLESKYIPEISQVHIQALKGDFLPSLGQNFLNTLYRGLIDRKGIYGYVDLIDNRVTGFIIGTKNMDVFLKQGLKANFLKLSYYLGLEIFKNPLLIKKVFETFLYSKKDQGVKAELVVIAILSKWQGRGIGRKLVRVLEDRFKKEKIRKYKLTVYRDKKAVHFYEKLNFIEKSGFNLYGKDWSVYEKKII